MAPRIIKTPLLTCFNTDNIIEIGMDESGRGPMFGRLYVAAVILPKDETSGFEHFKMRDSKTIKSRKVMTTVANYIKANAIAYHIHYIEADVIDNVNIAQANMNAMHICICEILKKVPNHDITSTLIIVDGNYFKPYTLFDSEICEFICYRSETVIKGDGKYSSIAAASILAKDARDSYIESLCETYPQLHERYGMLTNFGYGTKTHIDGIHTHGITQFHRRTFGLCKESPINEIHQSNESNKITL
jgi:ribonuclease HII